MALFTDQTGIWRAPTRKTGMTLLSGLKVVQIGSGPAAAVCGRLLADVGAHI